MRDLTPRRADTTAVIGSALLASARGTGAPADRRPTRPAAVHGAALDPRAPRSRTRRVAARGPSTGWTGSTVTSNVITRSAAGVTVVMPR